MKKYPLPTAPKSLAVLRALHRGDKLTVRDALLRFGCYALSQRIGDLIALGWPIKKRWKETADSRVREYSL